jgi:hypothetical protein
MCFFALAEQAYFAKKEPFAIQKMLICRKYYFQKHLNSHNQTMCEMLQLRTLNVFFGQIHMVLEPS